ncbi:branched-chain amino acid ABC transporter permease [Aquabacter sp. CN5-332]|uniref:branched-chain amino acid ABC transporter permease n=1 Tax=Aquabacter sp. CN5-332 TaxID=3156608 RepID=UPI0032B5B5C7
MNRALAIAFVILAPLVVLFTAGDNQFLVFIVGITLIHMLLASGLNLLYGYTGLIPLTYAGIAGISAYATANLSMFGGLSFWLALPLGSLLAAAVGVLLSLPAIRLRGFYFALSGLVIQSAMSIAFVYFPRYTNGDTGIASIPRPTLFGAALPSPWIECLLGVFVIAVVGVVWLIMRSRFGASLIAIREDEDLARALGVSVTLNRTVSFAIASFIAGIGGGLYAYYVGFVSPRAFDVLVSLNIWLMAAMGGRATLVGPLLGALILAPLPFFLQQYTWLKDVIYGLAIILVTMYLPSGIYGYLLKRRARS